MSLHWDQGTTAMRTAATGTLVAVADEDTADSDGREGQKDRDKDRETERQRDRETASLFSHLSRRWRGRRVTHIAESHPIISCIKLSRNNAVMVEPFGVASGLFQRGDGFFGQTTKFAGKTLVVKRTCS